MAKVMINEAAEEQLISYIISEAFVPKTELVLLVKDYMDKNFVRQNIDDIENGYPKKVPTVVMLSEERQPLKTLQLSEFLRLLDDKFHKLIKNDKDRKKFLKQVIIDWYNKTISKEGLLTKNHL